MLSWKPTPSSRTGVQPFSKAQTRCSSTKNSASVPPKLQPKLPTNVLGGTRNVNESSVNSFLQPLTHQQPLPQPPQHLVLEAQGVRRNCLLSMKRRLQTQLSLWEGSGQVHRVQQQRGHRHQRHRLEERGVRRARLRNKFLLARS